MSDDRAIALAGAALACLGAIGLWTIPPDLRNWRPAAVMTAVILVGIIITLLHVGPITP